MADINHSIPIPLYYQLKLLIQEQIEAGELKPGDKVPTEAELCQRYNISRTPVRQALLELTREGLLTRTVGRGTFVAPAVEKAVILRLTVPDGETTQRLCRLARRLDLAIVAGLVEQVPGVTGMLYDTAVLIDRRGQFVGRYRKSHLYPAETHYFRAGDSLPVFELDGLRIGIATCFEAAFPPIFSTLALKGPRSSSIHRPCPWALVTSRICAPGPGPKTTRSLW